MKIFISFLISCLLYQSVQAQDTVRQIKIAKGQVYLSFPVKESNKLTRTRIKYGGKMVDQFTIKLATEKPDYWVFFDAAPYQGKTLTVEISKTDVIAPGAFSNITQSNNTNVNKEAEEDRTKGLKMVFADSKFPGQDSVYKEVSRPQVHFSARRGWINDPNGLLYYNGEYHMFFQHNPYGWAWGNMHWGHAVSKDLVHWKELPEAIYPFGDRDAAFSGSAVVDPKNTAGFRKNGIDPLIAVYTSTGRGECLKLSYDNGKTFTEYEGNPILVHKGRDPKVFWYEPGNHWVMVVWDFSKTKKMSLGQEAVINQHLIYTSPDLKNWTEQSGVTGFFECPELFELPVEGQPGVSKWIMYDATGRYVVGDFDGKKFLIDQHLKKYDYGGGYFYASQTFNNTPDKRRIQVGWGRGIIHPVMPFNQAMLFPIELKLKKTFDGLRLCPTPIKEISTLHTNTQTFENKILKVNDSLMIQVKGDAVHIIAEFEKGDAHFGLNVLGYEFSYNDLLGEFITLLKAPATVTDYVKPDTENFKIEAIVDKNMLEVFVNDGETYYAMPFDGPKTGKITAFIKGRGSDRKTILRKMEVHELKSIWSNANNLTATAE
jgi:fructan beta-fructosidase